MFGFGKKSKKGMHRSLKLSREESAKDLKQPLFLRIVAKNSRAMGYTMRM